MRVAGLKTSLAARIERRGSGFHDCLADGVDGNDCYDHGLMFTSNDFVGAYTLLQRGAWLVSQHSIRSLPMSY